MPIGVSPSLVFATECWLPGFSLMILITGIQGPWSPRAGSLCCFHIPVVVVGYGGLTTKSKNNRMVFQRHPAPSNCSQSMLCSTVAGYSLYHGFERH